MRGSGVPAGAKAEASTRPPAGTFSLIMNLTATSNSSDLLFAARTKPNPPLPSSGPSEYFCVKSWSRV